MYYLFKKFSKFYSLTRLIEPKELVFSMWLQICLFEKVFYSHPCHPDLSASTHMSNFYSDPSVLSALLFSTVTNGKSTPSNHP